MKKSRILAVGLVGILLAVGLIMAGCMKGTCGCGGDPSKCTDHNNCKEVKKPVENKGDCECETNVSFN